jgi:hypothetical protein
VRLLDEARDLEKVASPAVDAAAPKCAVEVPAHGVCLLVFRGSG